MDLNSRLTLHPLVIRQDQHHYIVEAPHLDEFFEMPQVCVDAIEALNSGAVLGDIQERLSRAYPDEEVDMLDFANQLVEFGLVREVDGQVIGGGATDNGGAIGTGETNRAGDPSKVSAMTRISPKIGSFFFNRLTIKLYTILFVVNVILFLFNPHLFPTYGDLFIFDAMMLNMITWLSVSLVFVLIHELGHILAARAYDLPTKLGLGHRMFFIVFETDLTHAWRLPSRDRNVLYLAGMCFEQVLLIAALLVQLMFPSMSPVLLGIIGIIVLDIVIKCVYQCCIYMKTDLYYVFENRTGAYNLMENAQQRLAHMLPFRKDNQNSAAHFFDGEHKIIRSYAIFYALGVVLMVLLLVFYMLPVLIRSFSIILPNVLLPVTSVYFWDAVAFLCQFVLMTGLLLHSWRKTYVNKHRKAHPS